MKNFKIEIQETLARDIEVKASSYEEALEKVKDQYYELFYTLMILSGLSL